MPCQRSMSKKRREIKDAVPKKHEPKKYMMMNEKIAHTFKNFKAKEREACHWRT
jgi:hypothetical protein